MNMGKVINRIETICNICKENTWRTEFSSDTIYPLLSDALAMLKEQPEIIRCKDCRYWQDKWEQDKFSEENHTTMPCIEMATTDDFYCGFAKEKDGEQ